MAPETQYLHWLEFLCLRMGPIVFGLMNQTDELPTLRVLFRRQGPDILPCAHIQNGRLREHCMYPGLMVEIFGILSRAMNVYIDFTMDTNNSYYDSLCDMLDSKGYDVFGLSVRSTAKRQEECDVSAEIFSMRPYLYVRSIDPVTHSWWNILLIYDTKTWICIIIFLFIEGLFAYVALKLERAIRIQNDLTFGQVIWQMIRIQLFQSDELNFKLTAGMFSVSVFALLQSTIIFGMYSSLCLSSLMKDNGKSYLRSEEYVYRQLATGKRKLVSYGPLEAFRESILERKEQTYRELQLLLQNDSFEAHDTESGVIESYSQQQNFLYDYSSSELANQVMTYCDSLVTDIIFPTTSRHLLLPKNSPWTAKLNRAIVENYARFKSIYKRYNVRRRDALCFRYEPGDPLKLTFYNGLLIIFGIMITLGVGVLTIEILYRKLRSRATVK
ncbi:unnamed protein product [Bursaphelenchus xylophilus]|uniref:(pine wood nematode) hypothetical protein n=1 Tax=Bursaphelenchus xylophilus TaxID=6326 RepID=A0A7I8X448_BURXY|nr:unnamed protein product [Bursaphelenchus xylophilus]CAG9128928.1 unnamed protein product [Bursaphelenchus xylophilus]